MIGLTTEMGTVSAIPRVAEVMDLMPVKVPREALVGEVRPLALARGVRHIIVVFEGHAEGIAEVADLLDAAPTSPVVDLMRSPIPTVGAAASLEEVAELLLAHELECIPVIAGDLIVGTVDRRALNGALKGW